MRCRLALFVLLLSSSACSTDTEEPLPTARDGGTEVADAGEVPRDGGFVRDGGVVPSRFPGELTNWCTGQHEYFSFFVTSMSALWTLSDSAPDDLNGGFGGDFGGIEGADELCQTIANATGNGDRTWRAFLSATDDGSGNPLHAIERIGEGPWYDANGRLVASGLAGLAGDRPDGVPQSVEDLPDECGVPISALGDAHDVVTGSDATGHLAANDPDTTCNDWTSSDGAVGSTGGMFGLGTVMCGHSFPRAGGRRGGRNWVSDHGLRGCGKGANLLQNGAGTGTCIGCSGGYGAVYCFVRIER